MIRSLSPHVVELVCRLVEMMAAEVGESRARRSSSITSRSLHRARRSVRRGLACRRGRIGSGLQIAEQSRKTVAVAAAGRLNQLLKIRNDSRSAVVTASLKKRDQVGHKMVAAVTRRRRSRVRRSRGRRRCWRSRCWR